MCIVRNFFNLTEKHTWASGTLISLIIDWYRVLIEAANLALKQTARPSIKLNATRKLQRDKDHTVNKMHIKDKVIITLFAHYNYGWFGKECSGACITETGVKSWLQKRNYVVLFCKIFVLQLYKLFIGFQVTELMKGFKYKLYQQAIFLIQI